VTAHDDFLGLPRGVRDWLAFEQTVNDRISNAERQARIDEPSTGVLPEFRPEHRPVWTQLAVVLPAAETRGYGFPGAVLEKRLGLENRAGKAHLFVHPQSHGLYRSEIARFGVASPAKLRVTPTASYRSLLAWRATTEPPVVIKTSLDLVVGGLHRALQEHEIACALMVNRLLEEIPPAHKEQLRFDCFREEAGLVLAKKRHGWLLRTLPDSLCSRRRYTTLVPAFSLISTRGDRPPLLVELIKSSGRSAERFVAEQILLPYVNVLSHLLFAEGISLEAHTQNVLYEVSARSKRLTGAIVLRDLSDASVNIALRVARNKPLPAFARGYFPKGAPFSIVSATADHFAGGRRPRNWRARTTIERHGMLGFVWAVNHAVQECFPAYRKDLVNKLYLELWQKAAAGYLGVTPLFDAASGRIAVDEAIALYLRETDWAKHGPRPRARLPEAAEPLVTGKRTRRRAGPAYARIRTAWGDLYLDGSEPAFLMPAF
jgi:hypothetical protein